MAWCDHRAKTKLDALFKPRLWVDATKFGSQWRHRFSMWVSDALTLILIWDGPIFTVTNRVNQGPDTTSLTLTVYLSADKISKPLVMPTNIEQF